MASHPDSMSQSWGVAVANAYEVRRIDDIKDFQPGVPRSDVGIAALDADILRQTERRVFVNQHWIRRVTAINRLESIEPGGNKCDLHDYMKVQRIAARIDTTSLGY